MFNLVPFNRRNNHVSVRRGNDIFDLRNVFDDFFNDPFFSGFPSASHPMKADIRENEKEYLIEAEIPGVKKEDIKLDLRDDVLTIMVEQNQQVNEEKDNYIRKERRYGSFSRSFHVENIKNEDVTAKYDNGILSISLPKREERRPDSHRIDIQ